MTTITKQDLLDDGYTIEKTFHNEECYYYYVATKGRDILTSHNGETFTGYVASNDIGEDQ